MNRDHVRYFFLFVAAAGVGYLCFLMAAPFLIAISWAAVIAIIINPVNDWLRRRLNSSNLAAALACVVALLSIILPIVAISIAIFRALAGFLANSDLQPPSEPSRVSDWVVGELGLALDWVARNLGIENLNLQDFKSAALNLGNVLVNQSKDFLGGIAGFLFNLVIVIFTLFFFLRDHDKILRGVREFLPISDENADAVFRRVADVIMASVIGGGAVSLAQGILGTLSYWILAIPNPLLWGLATSFFSFIPFVGAAAVWVPMAIVLVIQGSYWKALILVCLGTFVISMVDNILRPILIGDRTRLHTLLIFFAILGGLKVFGFLGLIMGPVVLAIGFALVEIFRREIQESHGRLEASHVDPGSETVAEDESMPART